MNIDMNDMYLEDSTVAFDMLEDNPTAEVVENASMGMENVEAEDLYNGDEDEIDFESVTDDGEPTEVAEDVEEVEETEEEVIEEEIEDLEEEVDFEEYEVTLPNGEMVKLHEAIKGYKDSQALQAERDAFEETKQAFETNSQDIKRILELGKLEAQRVIEDYEGFDWESLSKEDPQAFVENRQFLDKYKQRHREILAEMEHIEKEAQEAKEASFREEARIANETLSQNIPGWNKDMYVDLMTYGVKDLGMSEDFIVNCTNPGVFMAIYKARTLDTGKQTVKAKIKKLNTAPSPKKVVKPAAKQTKPASTKTAVIKKIESGQADPSDWFSQLED